MSKSLSGKERGQLWGWDYVDGADEAARRMSEFMGAANMCLMNSNAKLYYPKHDLSCIQLEIWVRGEAGNDIISEK